MPFTYDFPRPAVTVDVCAFAATDAGLRILLIERAREPFAGRHALPGGFVDIDEDLEPAARRELAEETGVAVGPMLQVGAFGAVHRDPRGRSIGVAFAALFVGEPPEGVAGDDARAARWRSAERLPRLAFDHREIVQAARSCVCERILLDGSAAALMTPPFTLGDLRTVAEQFGVARGSAAAERARLRRDPRLRATRARRGREGLYRWVRGGKG
jgi:8-oxo-dGTP diphosphatase